MLERTEGKVRLAVLVSGRGSNCEAIARACLDGSLPDCEVALVISNVPGAPAIDRAREMGLTAVTLEGRGRDRQEHEEAVASLLRKFRVNLICLAGYLRVLSADFVADWSGRLLNIHPSLLPAFPGLHSQRKALDYGAQFSGCTVHFVDETVDGGVIIVQRPVEILDDDTVDTLTERILGEEHLAYIEGIRRVIGGEFEVRERRYVRVEPVQAVRLEAPEGDAWTESDPPGRSA